MLREADLLSNDNTINRVVMTPALEAVIGEDNPADFAVFPVTHLQRLDWMP